MLGEDFFAGLQCQGSIHDHHSLELEVEPNEGLGAALDERNEVLEVLNLHSVELVDLDVGGVLIAGVDIVYQDLGKQHDLLIRVLEIGVDGEVAESNGSLAIPLLAPLMSKIELSQRNKHQAGIDEIAWGLLEVEGNQELGLLELDVPMDPLSISKQGQGGSVSTELVEQEMLEGDPFVVSKLHCTIVGDGMMVDFQEDVVLLNNLVPGTQWIDSVDDKTRHALVHLEELLQLWVLHRLTDDSNLAEAGVAAMSIDVLKEMLDDSRGNDVSNVLGVDQCLEGDAHHLVALSAGPPLLPELMAASIWMARSFEQPWV
jgi:hypothetical protein